MNNENEELINNKTSLSGILEELNNVENDIISYFTNSSIRTGRDKIFASVLSHFYLRKELTQKELQKLTEYSAGAISEALKQCIDMNFVVEEKQWRKPFKYKMHSILEPFIKNFKDVIKLYSDQEDDFRKIQNWILNISHDQVPEKSHKIYDSLIVYLENFFKFLIVYKKIEEYLKEIGEKS